MDPPRGPEVATAFFLGFGLCAFFDRLAGKGTPRKNNIKKPPFYTLAMFMFVLYCFVLFFRLKKSVPTLGLATFCWTRFAIMAGHWAEPRGPCWAGWSIQLTLRRLQMQLRESNSILMGMGDLKSPKSENATYWCSMMLIAGWKKFYSANAVGITRSSSVFKMDHAAKVEAA